MKKIKIKLSPTLGGLASGFINGLLGAGGGMLTVPILKSFDLERKEAHANSVAVIMPLSLFSAILYLVAGKVEVSDVLPFLPWGLLGAVVGTAVLKKISNKWLKILFSAFMIWAGFRLLMR